MIAALALLAGCGGSGQHAQKTTKELVNVFTPRTAESKGKPLTPEQMAALCKLDHISPCSATLSKAQVQAIRRKIAKRCSETHCIQSAPQATVHVHGPSGKALTTKEAAAVARQLEARCRAEHEPCIALGGVELTTKRYKVEIK